ncbi:MAG: hypothetical protein ACXAEF_14785 [Candidatus Thorarchaeota archaeon]|jgi:hypothetical protein
MMSRSFSPNSRYFGLRVVRTHDKSGREVSAISLRKIPLTLGKKKRIEGSSRLDIIAHETYRDSTKWWHIADANTALDAIKLICEEYQILEVPDT